MIYNEIFFGIIALISRFLTMGILSIMIRNQWKTLKRNLKDGVEQLRYIVFILLITLFIQNIFPIFTVLIELTSVERADPFFYWLNNALFSLITAVILLFIYRKK